MKSRVSRYMNWVFTLAFIASMPLALAAQDAAKPAVKAPADDSASKWDIFLGYSYLAPSGKIHGVADAAPGSHYGQINWGGILSVSRYFNKNLGVQIEGDEHMQSEDWPAGDNNASYNSNDDFAGGSGGLIYRIPTEHFTPFVHALVGGERVGSIYRADTWGAVATAGGGLDLNTPLFNHHLAIRIFQTDYQYIHADSSDINAFRLSTGLVYHIGSFETATQVTLACSANPASIFPGDPVTVTATAGGLNPKLNVIYSYSGSGVSGSGTTVTVATAALAPGSYTVKCGVKEGRAGREGLKPWETADASTSFTVKAFEPPTINCSASPDTIKPGETSNITAAGVSPQNRPLTYVFSASSGSVTSSGSAAVFNSTGAPTGAASITCNVADDKGQTATANTSVNIMAPIAAAESPEVKQLETRLALHSVFFQTDQPRPERPNGGLLASQEGTLTTLASDFKKYLAYKPEAHLTLTGHADVRGSVEYNQALSERRVARTKQFLVEQGLPEAKIETSGLGKEHELTADQVKELVEQNPDLNDAERAKVLRDLNVIVLAQNRRVDVTLSTTGQQSVRLYPFNAADSLTLIDQRNLTQRKKAVSPVKK